METIIKIDLADFGNLFRTDPAKLTDQELLSLDFILHRAWKHKREGGRVHFGDKTWSFEDLINLHALVRKEMATRAFQHTIKDELDSQTDALLRGQEAEAAKAEELAPVYPSGIELGREITLDEVLPQIKSFYAHPIFAWIVGGLANWSKTKGDIDILWWAKPELPDYMKKILEFRFGRQFNDPEIARRVQFHLNWFEGPFTKAVPIYALKVDRINPQGEVKEAAVQEIGFKPEPVNLVWDDVRKGWTIPQSWLDAYGAGPEAAPDPAKKQLRSATQDVRAQAEASAREDKVKLFRFFQPPKPTRGHKPDEPQTVDTFLRGWRPDDFPVYSSKKYDGGNYEIHSDGERVVMWSEDGRDNTARFPQIAAAFKAKCKGKKVAALAEIERWQGNRHLPRESVIAYVNEAGEPDDSDFVANVYDVGYYWTPKRKCGDVHKDDFKDRLQMLDDLGLPQSMEGAPDLSLKLNLVPHHKNDTPEDLRKETERLRQVEGSEGNVATSHAQKMRLDGGTSRQLKFHNAAILRGIVIEVTETKTPDVFNFLYGLDFQNMKVPNETIHSVTAKLYHEVGTTFSSALKADVGDIIDVEFETLNVTKNSEEGTIAVTAWAPRVLGISKRGQPMTIGEAIKKAKEGFVLQEKEITEEGETIFKGVRQAFGSYGGKRFLAHRIASYILHHRTYVEPFAGGAAVFFAKDPSPREVLNDRDTEIAFMYRFIRDMAPEDRQALSKRDWVIRKDIHERLKALKPANDRDRFYKAFYLTRSSYGKQRGGSFNPANAGVMIDFPANIERAQKRLQKVAIHSKDYLAVLKEYDGPETFFYMDPPYPGKYNLFDFGFKHEHFIKALKNLKAKWIVSYPTEGASAFKGFHVYRVKRRNQMKGPGGNQEWVTELLVSNFPLKPLHLYIEKELAASPGRLDVSEPQFSSGCQGTKINSPTLAYMAVYGHPPKTFLPSQISHPARNWKGIQVDEHLKDEWLDALNDIPEIELRASCEGHSPERVAFIVFRLRENEDKTKDLAERLDKLPEIYSRSDIGMEGRPRIVVAGKTFFGESKWMAWWSGLADKIKSALLTLKQLEFDLDLDDEVHPFLPHLDEDDDLEKVQAAFKSPGGKYRLYKKLIRLIPEHKTFVEAFCGGAQVFFHKKRSDMEIINDVNSDLISAYRFIKNMTPEDLSWLKKQHWIISRARAKKLFAMKPRTPRERFYRFVYLNKSTYWGRTDVWEGIRTGRNGEGYHIRLVDRLPQIQERLKNVKLLSWDWKDVIREYDSKDTFFYFDPPYPLHWPKEGGGHGSKFFEEDDLLPTLRKIKGKFILSYELEKVNIFKGFKTYRVKTLWTGMHQKGVRYKYELLASNFPLKSTNLYVEKSLEPIIKQDEIYNVNPPEDETYRYVYQRHFRGRSEHGDIRIESINKEFLIGWTISELIPGIIKQPVETLADARGWSKDGSAFKIDFKTGKFKERRTRAGNIVPAQLRAFPKAKEPHVWLEVEGVTGPYPAPGATKEHPGVFLIEDKGIAEYGCFPPGQCVLTSEGFRPVETIKKGQYLLGLQDWTEVVETFSRSHEGKIIKCFPRGMPNLEVTPNHPILAFKNPPRRMNRSWLRNTDIKPEPRWMRADELQIGDFIAVPKAKLPTDHSPCIAFDSRLVLLDEDLAWFLGRFIADGHASHLTPQSVELAISNPLHVDRIVQIGHKAFGLEAKIDPQQGHDRVYLHSRELSRFLRYHCYTPIGKKRIPLGVLNASDNIVMALLRGLYDGDGDKSSSIQLRYTSTSPDVLWIFSLLMTRMGYLPSNGRRNTSPALVWLRRHCDLLGSMPEITKGLRCAFLEDEKFIYTPVRHIEERDYSGLVYNLETKDNTILTPLVTHNSQKLDTHEYFLNGKLRGRLVIRRLPRAAFKKVLGRSEANSCHVDCNENGTVEIFKATENGMPEKRWIIKVLPPGKFEEAPITTTTFWVAIQPIDQTPIVLTEREVEKKWIPPFGISALPKAVRKLIPPKFHYWKIKDRTKALENRAALVEALKNKEIKIDFNKAILGETLEKKVQVKVPFVLQYQFFRGPISVRAGPSEEFWNIRVATSPNRVLNFQLSANPLQADKLSATLEIEKTDKYMETEGDIPPGSPLNPTKDTPSSIVILDKGEALMLIDEDTFKKFEFKGEKLNSLWVAKRTNVRTTLWEVAQSAQVKAEKTG